MITIKMFFEATEEEYKKTRITPKDFYGVIQVSRESIRKKKESEIEAVADREIQAFIILFKKEIVEYWRKLHAKERLQETELSRALPIQREFNRIRSYERNNSAGHGRRVV